MLRHRALALIAAAALAGCSWEPGPLIDAAGWAEVGAADDPFDDRPGGVECDVTGYGEELGIFEVETDLCPYGTFSQPILRDVGPGATVHLVAWHLDLFAAEPAEGHFVVQIGDLVLIDERPSIPSDEEIWDLEIPWPAGVAAAREGDDAWVHVHNHGTNSWRVGVLEIVE